MAETLGTYVILPPKAVREEIAETEQKGRSLLGALETFEIDDVGQAQDLLSEIHRTHQVLDRKRKEVTKPALEAKKTLDTLFKPALSVWSQAKAVLRGKLEEYHDRAEAERREAIAKASKGEGIVPAPPALPTTREEWVVIVENIDQIPREFLTVDWSALKLLAKKGKTAPPGVRFERKSRVIVDSRRSKE